MIAFAIFQCTINVFACLLYIIEGYVQQSFIASISLGIAIYFSIEMIGNFYVHPSPRYRYFTDIDTWVDF